MGKDYNYYYEESNYILEDQDSASYKNPVIMYSLDFYRQHIIDLFHDLENNFPYLFLGKLDEFFDFLQKIKYRSKNIIESEIFLIRKRSGFYDWSELYSDLFDTIIFKINYTGIVTVCKGDLIAFLYKLALKYQN